MKTRIFKTGVVPWEYTLHVLWPVTPDRIVAYANRIGGDFTAQGPFQGVFFELEHDVVIGFTSRRPPANIIVHEVVHAVRAMLISRGIELSRETDEVYAYLIGHLFDKVSKAVHIKK